MFLTALVPDLRVLHPHHNVLRSTSTAHPSHNSRPIIMSVIPATKTFGCRQQPIVLGDSDSENDNVSMAGTHHNPITLSDDDEGAAGDLSMAGTQHDPIALSDDDENVLTDAQPVAVDSARHPAVPSAESSTQLPRQDSDESCVCRICCRERAKSVMAVINNDECSRHPNAAGNGYWTLHDLESKYECAVFGNVVGATDDKSLYHQDDINHTNKQYTEMLIAFQMHHIDRGMTSLDKLDEALHPCC